SLARWRQQHVRNAALLGQLDQHANAGGLAHARSATDDRYVAAESSRDRAPLLGLQHEVIGLLRPLELVGLEQRCIDSKQLSQASRRQTLVLVQLAGIDA